MQLESTSPINNSKAKAEFRFSKDIRFKPLKLATDQIGYTPMTQFEKIVDQKSTGVGTRFGGASRRFEYHPSKRKQGQSPSAADYNSHAMKTRKGQDFHRDNAIREAISTFGESRDKVKRLGVDRILYSPEPEGPAPGSYQKFVEWGTAKDHSSAKTTPQFSMG